ncbi:hypothetical protein GCM10011608_10130 [Micromonospora sonchi]|uniref:Uncharacterized protein n=1 Tax=Micromonospora sonchi TaxID=1763543 RepID=A0A917TL85_9ACTN|nr:hypothetical protein [Micromonospora sonchi]GGM27349.1 hypothetical protein GCM10011608_10130 [Micromonospora sonchi]
MIAKRIPHKAQCDHAQTPYARRKCRATKLAAAQEATMQTTPTHQPGDEIDIDGITVVLARRKGNNGYRWTWYAPQLEEGGELYKATPEEAIDYARRALAGPTCACGNIATSIGSTERVCTACL